ncbi:MAG: 5'/3'-nucleotidase SurE [Opitutales bacterium]|nr:5'/3'-nucleotidase SurE [Opitutales bacterium]MBT5168172.1 5'/3'-nucleotidase SurE [Opitutales bacterium]
MKILITNDDGIDSPFLKPLAETFAENHDVTVVAPRAEQSWIGKAMSRRGTVEMETHTDFPGPAYSLSGTPSDCVNIALAHLCPTQPDLVISGINIGHNAGLSFIASSGTIGGALEASLQNLPAIAASMYLDPEAFRAVSQRDKALSNDLEDHLVHATRILKTFASTFIENHRPQYGQVHSLNFPNRNLDQASIHKARTARTLSSSLFERDGDQFRFAYKPLETLDGDEDPTDRNFVHQGQITHTIIDYSTIDQKSYK